MTRSDYTHLAFVIDRSGSMAPIKTDMEGSIRTVLDEQGKAPGELHVDVWTFDTKIEHPYRDARADDVKGELISPRGGTALSDAIAAAVSELGERFAALDESERPGKVILAIVTDGLENSSREYPGAAGSEAVKAMVEKQRDEFNWEILFLGADSIDAFSAAASYGVGRAQTLSFAHTTDGAVATASAMSGYMTRSRAGEATEFTEAEREAAR